MPYAFLFGVKFLSLPRNQENGRVMGQGVVGDERLTGLFTTVHRHGISLPGEGSEKCAALHLGTDMTLAGKAVVCRLVTARPGGTPTPAQNRQAFRP